jgi:hypothetical protein
MTSDRKGVLRGCTVIEPVFQQAKKLGLRKMSSIKQT